jgi:diguanylate cyclase (GGDEF)-like protein/PAS domain S-box-containing protein
MSLRLKLLLPLVIACLVALAYIDLVWSPRSLETEKQSYLNEVSRHLDTVVAGLVPLMLTNQLDLIQENLGELRKKNQEWQFILLTNNQGKQLYPPLLDGVGLQPVPGMNVQALGKEIHFLDKHLGKLVVHVAYGSRLDEIRAQHRQLTLTLLTMIVLLAMIWVITLEAVVVQPLQRLSSAATELANQHFNTPLPKSRGDEVGKLIGNFATMRNDIKTYHDELRHEIEARKQVEVELRCFKAIVDFSDDAIISKDLMGIITSWNDGAEKIFGYSADETIGKPMQILIPPERAYEEADILSHIIRGERVKHFETVRRHKDGHLIHISASISPLFDQAGKAVGASKIARDITERKNFEAIQRKSTQMLESQLEKISELQARLQEQVIRDPLTGIFNRRYLDETMPRELSRAKREGYSLSLVMLDLDHFKRVNDTYGHAAGDEVLKTIAKILGEKGRDTDISCRYGGEEFVVALPRMSPAQAIPRVEEWRAALSETRIRHGELEIAITLSAGVAGYPDHGADLDTLMSRADEALYRSKDQGRNRVTCYGQTVTQEPV